MIAETIGNFATSLTRLVIGPEGIYISNLDDDDSIDWIGIGLIESHEKRKTFRVIKKNEWSGVGCSLGGSCRIIFLVSVIMVK